MSEWSESSEGVGRCRKVSEWSEWSESSESSESPEYTEGRLAANGIKPHTEGMEVTESIRAQRRADARREGTEVA